MRRLICTILFFLVAVGAANAQGSENADALSEAIQVGRESYVHIDIDLDTYHASSMVERCKRKFLEAIGNRTGEHICVAAFDTNYRPHACYVVLNAHLYGQRGGPNVQEVKNSLRRGCRGSLCAIVAHHNDSYGFILTAVTLPHLDHTPQLAGGGGGGGNKAACDAEVRLHNARTTPAGQKYQIRQRMRKMGCAYIPRG